MVDEEVDGTVIKFDRLSHKVSGGVCQGNLVSSVLFVASTKTYGKRVGNAIYLRCGIE